MESELYEATMKGNVHSLLGKDKLLLDRIMIGNHNETPLHIATMLGHLDAVEAILARKAELAREQDYQSSTPLHLAAAKGYLDIVESLFINSRDEDGNTILHLAASNGQIETIIYLTSKGVDSNIMKSKGFMALSLLAQGQSVERASEIKDSAHQTSENHDLSRQTDAKNMVTEESKREEKRKWQNDMHKMLMVVAALVAIIAYEAGREPPKAPPKAPPDMEWLYKVFMAFNMISFMASLSTIMLLISGLPLKQRRITTWIAMLSMWVAITFTVLSYSILMVLSSPDEGEIKYANDKVVVTV
ncbi:ankyrin repeat domain-containing protein 27-like [Eucalyptus grandis]|uniref:ankyrin repeat domain-containing protein 27-like n=1 Tax=Eucalyptus grandis TaxID=71139 RepID=UPI00192EB13D|nr:ankyrin repeat domain-containing protein 27-like [Eucalyptus grandis]